MEPTPLGRFLLGPAIWLGMALQTALLSTLVIAFVIFGWVPYVFAIGSETYRGANLLRQAWPVFYLELFRPLAALTMPLWIALWGVLSERFAYLLNTPDDQDPVNQGWNGTQKEAQVQWVRQHCGAFWCRVYWLQRNCLYGLAVRSKPDPINVKLAVYVFYQGWLGAEWPGGFALERIGYAKIGSRYLSLAFGADVHAYVDRLTPILIPNAKPETDPTKDTGGVPCVKVKFRSERPY